MSKEFKPIFERERDQIRTFAVNGDTDDKKPTPEKGEDPSLLKKKIEELEGERERLLGELSYLKEELLKKEEEIKRVIEEKNSQKITGELVQKLSVSFEIGLKDAREQIKKDWIDLAKKVIKEFLLTDLVPKEELVTKILEQVFEKTFDLKGSVRVHLNPSDVDRVYDFIAELKEKLSEKVEVEIETDETLREGEIRIETPKFVIERKHEEIIEEIFREAVKDVLEGG